MFYIFILFDLLQENFLSRALLWSPLITDFQCLSCRDQKLASIGVAQDDVLQGQVSLIKLFPDNISNLKDWDYQKHRKVGQ